MKKTIKLAFWFIVAVMTINMLLVMPVMADVPGDYDPMNVTDVIVAEVTQIQVVMPDIGLQTGDFVLTDNTNPGVAVMITNATYADGKYTLTLGSSGISYYNTYTVTITKEGYATYTNNNLYYGTLATDSDLDLIHEPNIFDTYTRDYANGVVTINNNTYTANALLYPGSSLYTAIDTTNGNAISAAIGDYKVVGAFVKAPPNAKGAKSLYSNGVMTKLEDDSLIDSNPNFMETVASGKAAYGNGAGSDPGNHYWQTIAFAPMYMKTSIKQIDTAWLLYDPADRLRIIEWYDNEACTGPPIEIVRFMMKVEYTGTTSLVPAAPANPVQNDTAYTFGWTNVTGFTSISDYQYSLDGGATWDDVTANPQSIPGQAYAIGEVQVRIKADHGTGRTAGAALASTEEYTAGPARVHLVHNEVTTDYLSIQSAVNAAVDGDTINIDAGIFREQVTITKNITLQGAGMEATIIEAPNKEQLVQSGGNWKDLKLRDIFAIVAIKTSTDGSVTIKDITVNGRDQGYLPLANIDPTKIRDNSYDFQGISVLNSNAVIDSVKVTRVRELASDYGGSLPSGYMPADQPAGMNHNDSIFAESAQSAGKHTVIIKNSIITKFQKTGILVWGPTLEVEIDNNTIQGYGKTLYSTGNGIQVGSTDYTGRGGGDRRGTSADITNNRILDIGLVIPSPSDNLGYKWLLDVSNTLIYYAGEVNVIGNTFTGPGVRSWYSNTTSYYNEVTGENGYGSTGLGINGTLNVVVEDNSFTGFDNALIESDSPASSYITISGNTFSNNVTDIWTSKGNDKIVLGSNAEILGYNTTVNGVDTVSNFGIGDKIRVIGFAPGSVNGNLGESPVVDFTGGSVTAGDGTNVVAHSVQVSVYSNNITTLYIDTDGVAGAPELQINLAGRYLADNFVLAGGYIKYQKMPTLDAYIPADNAVNVRPDANLAMTFSENVTAVAGKSIVIKKASDDSVVETIDATDSKVQVAGASVTINPSADLYYSTEYFVQIDAGAFKNAQNVNYEGISDETTWNLATEMKSEVTINTSAELAHYIANPHISVINLVYGNYQYNGGTVSRALTINGNDATIVAGTGIVENIIRSDGVIFYGLGNYLNEKTFIRVEGADGYLKLNHVTLQNGTNKNGTNTDDDGICAVINVKPGGSFEMDNITIMGFHNNPKPGNKNSLGIHAEPGAVKTIIKNSSFDSSNAFRNAVSIRSGNFEISNNTFAGTHYPERLRQDDGYEYAIYIFGGTGAVKKNTITGYDSTNQPGYTSAGIAVIGFYKADVTIEDNSLADNVSGIDVTGYWSGAGTNRDMKVNGKSLTDSESAYTIGEALKGPNKQEYVSVSLDQNDEVQLTDNNGKKYLTVLGGYRSPFLKGTGRSGNVVTVQLSSTDLDALNAADSIKFEIQVDSSTTWTETTATWKSEPTEVTLTLAPGHEYRIRAKMTHTSYVEPADPTARTLITYTNPVVSPAAPSVTADDGVNKVVGANATMEYSTDNGASWTDYDPANEPTFAGNWTVLVRVKTSGINPAGEAATLTFTTNPVAPVITMQPLNQTVIEGQTAVFAVAATGTALLSYQWKKGEEEIAGATSATLIINNARATDAGTYRVIINNVGGAVTSNGATLAVNAPGQFVLTATPGNGSVNLNWNSVSEAVYYSVYKNNDIVETVVGSVYDYRVGNITNGVTYSFVVKALDMNRVVIATSNQVSETPGMEPVILMQPQNQTVTTGQTAVFTVVVDGTASLSYRWKKGETEIEGVNSDTLTIDNVQPADAGTYRVVVTNRTGTVTSDGATLTVNEPGQFTLTVTPRNGYVNLNWNSVSEAVYYSVYKNNEFVETVVGSVYDYDVHGLTNGVAYSFEVRALDINKVVIATSNTVNESPRTVPGIPTGITAVAGVGQATVSFTAPADNGGSPITGYIVTASPGNITATGTTTSITVTGLTNGMSYTFTVRAVNRVGNGQESTPSNPVTLYMPSSGDDNYNPTPNPKPETTTTSADVLVNGKVENAGTATTTKEGEKTVTTITVDEKKLEQKLESEGNNAIVTIPVNIKSDVVIGVLNGQMVKNMENKQAVVEVKTETATYTLPAQQINIGAVSAQIGKNVELKDIKVQIEIAKAATETVKVVENSAKKGEFTIVVPPVEFTVRCTNGDSTVEISRFNAYVERTVAIPDGIDPNKITTGIVVEQDGTVRHVPTKVVLIGGRYYAKINSLTNSTYAVVWHPLEFRDVETHWAKEAVNDMGSRMVVSGVGNDMFEPDRDITRAEFAAIVVRALGLKPGTGKNPFSDVKAADWYCEFIETAYEYGILSGYGDGKFGPMDKITREQAMAMIARAMKITDLKVEFKADEIDKLLTAFADFVEVEDWAKDSIAACIKAEIVSGRNGKLIAPQDNITRAEVAAIVRRLLQKSELI